MRRLSGPACLVALKRATRKEDTKISPSNHQVDEAVKTLGSRSDFDVWANTVVAAIEALRRTGDSSQTTSYFGWAR